MDLTTIEIYTNYNQNDIIKMLISSLNETNVKYTFQDNDKKLLWEDKSVIFTNNSSKIEKTP